MASWMSLGERPWTRVYRHHDDEIAYRAHAAFRTECGIPGGPFLARGAPHLLLRNRFPYALRDAEHYVLWVAPARAHLYNAARARDIAEAAGLKVLRCWQNPLAHRSVRVTPHYHLITSIKFA